MLLQRLQVTEQQLLATYRDEASTDLIQALAAARVEAADKDFRILELEVPGVAVGGGGDADADADAAAAAAAAGFARDDDDAGAPPAAVPLLLLSATHNCRLNSSQHDLRRKAATVDKLRAALTRAEAKYRSTMNEALTPGTSRCTALDRRMAAWGRHVGEEAAWAWRGTQTPHSTSQTGIG